MVSKYYIPFPPNRRTRVPPKKQSIPDLEQEMYKMYQCPTGQIRDNVIEWDNPNALK